MIRFDDIEPRFVEHMRDGEGTIEVRDFQDDDNRVIRLCFPPKSSIGNHQHVGESEIFYVISGEATIITDGVEEIYKSGDVAYCPNNSNHTTINNGSEDLVLFAVISKHK